MASGKEIRTKIKSIQNTQKITKAMEMVAASKMGKAQLRMKNARPYAQKIKEVATHLSHANPEYRHPYLVPPVATTNNIGLVVISTDRGLCGGLNSNLFRALIKHLEQHNHQPQQYQVAVIGSKASPVIKRLGMNIISVVNSLGDIPDPERLVGITKTISDAFCNKEVATVHLASNKFINTVSQSPWIRTLLPLTMLEDDTAGAPTTPDASALPWDYLYEPDAKIILDTLMPMYLRSIVYQALLENIACEMASRMLAMKNASDNAADIIDELRLHYNKIRQSSITQEISEIVAGAAAV